MPYIIVKVGGHVDYNGGNGSLWVDGFPHSHIRDGAIIPVSEGSHSIKYVPTLKGTEWTVSSTFTQNTVMEAYVIDENFSAPSFTTHIASESELARIRSEISDQNMAKSFRAKGSRKKTGWYIPRCIIGIALVIAGIYVTFKFKQTDWKEYILPSALIAVGAALIKSYPIDTQVDGEEIAKGFFMGIGWFAVTAGIQLIKEFLGNLF